MVVIDIDAAAGRALADELGGSGVFFEGDVARPDIAKTAVDLAVSTFGKLTGLVNNAHGSTQKLFMDQEPADWELSFGTGFWATVQMMQAAHPELVRTKGSVVNFGSGSAMSGQVTQSAYAAAKEAIRGLSRVTANEWAPSGVRVNVVSPLALTGGIKAWAESSPELYQKVVDATPLGRLGDPQKDIAPIVAFLLSEDSQYMTGQTLMADGGTQKLY